MSDLYIIQHLQIKIPHIAVDIRLYHSSVISKDFSRLHIYKNQADYCSCSSLYRKFAT